MENEIVSIDKTKLTASLQERLDAVRDSLAELQPHEKQMKAYCDGQIYQLERLVDDVNFGCFDLESRQPAAPAWTAIRSEADLPRVSGEYLWQHNNVDEYGRLFIADHINVLDIDADWWLSEYVAYMPIPPYAPPVPEVKNV